MLVELRESRADRCNVCLAFRLRLRGDVRQAHRDQHAVDRAPLAILAQQRQELGPSGRIARAVGILRGETTGRIKKNRLVREPPVTVARAADAAQRFLAELLGQRKVESGVDDAPLSCRNPEAR